MRASLQDFSDGTTTSTGRGLDVAISGNGFFRMVDSNGSVFYYSRNGQFKLDENRNLVNMQGMQLTGYPANGYAANRSDRCEPSGAYYPEHPDGGEIHHHRSQHAYPT